MADPAKDDRDDLLMRRLYDEREPDGDIADGELAREVESLRRVRGAIAQYARATEVDPPNRGVDELLAAARARVPAARAAVAPEVPGAWARLRAWLTPVMAHPALASAAMVVLVAGVAGVLYIKGDVTETSSQREVTVTGPEPPAAPASGTSGAVAPTGQLDDGMVVRLDDGNGDGLAKQAAPEPAAVPAPRPTTITLDGKLATKKPRPKEPREGDRRGKGEDQLTSELPGLGRGGAGDDKGSLGGEIVLTDKNMAGTPPLPQSQPPPKYTAPVPRPTKRPMPNRPTVTPAPVTPPPPVTGGAAPEPTAPEEAPAVDSDATSAAPSKDEAPPRPRGPSLDQLTRQARTAARAGDCAVVKALAGRVRSASATYYKQTFAADADIKKCL